MMVELMFLPIMLGATLMHREREREGERERSSQTETNRQRSCLTCVYSHVVVYTIHTQSKPNVSG
jgi:hypothetical protein